MNEDHPAVKLGEWIKEKRIAKDITQYGFAKAIGMDICKCSEMHIGVGDWIHADPFYAHEIVRVLNMTGAEIEEFKKFLRAMENYAPLKMSDRFTRDDLYPIFLVLTKKITPEQAEAIVDKVMEPLK